MAHTRREKLFALIAACAVVLLIADHYVITPWFDHGAALAVEQESLTLELEDGQRALQRRQIMARKWDEMTAGGLSADVATTEAAILHALRDWAQQAGLALASMNPERIEGDGRLRQVAVQVAGTGTMQAVGRFLWRIETADLPVHVGQLTIGARTEGVDDLSLQVKLTTLYLGEEQAGLLGARGGGT